MIASIAFSVWMFYPELNFLFLCTLCLILITLNQQDSFMPGDGLSFMELWNYGVVGFRYPLLQWSHLFGDVDHNFDKNKQKIGCLTSHGVD